MLRVDVEEEGCALLVSDTTCLLGPCKNTPWKSLKSSNDLQWPEPRIHCCPQPPTMILSACRISSMYSSSAEATYEPACIQREKVHTEKMEAPTRLSSSSGTSWGMEKHKLKGNCKTIFINLQEQPAWNVLKHAIHFGELPKEGSWRERTKSTTMHQVKADSCCNGNAWIKHVCLQVFISVTNTELSSSRIVAIHKRDTWCFHVYPCS